MDIARVAEVIIGGEAGEPSRRASGYRVTAGAVITAAHAIGESSSVRVRFDADRPSEWVTVGTVAWLDKGIDLAVLAIEERSGEQIEPALFGRATEKDAVLSCSAVGFPRFKLRDDPGRDSQFRDSFHATGSIALLSNRREGTFEVTVAPPEQDPDPKVSPWQGMSGAALWSEGLIIGMEAAHHRKDGLGRLAATRVSRWYEVAPAASLGALTRLLNLPEHVEDLPEVTRTDIGALVMERYRTEARQVAPGVLVGRESELADLVKFCAGNEPYLWWRADPWAGKSALASWFVLHPPMGVAVASFLVMSRLAGQSDSDAFTEAMIEQLAFIAGEEIPAALNSVGRRREWGRLLESAAARCRERNLRLLLVIDGLDEDTGSRPSIAALLPRRPSDGLRIVVTSRRSRRLPKDVPADHPLRQCERRWLEPSPLASGLGIEAENELSGLLTSKDPLQIAVIGLMTASRGGLTAIDLAELTGSKVHDLSERLDGVFGRSLTSISPTDASVVRRDRQYLFAHEALREMAEQVLATDVSVYLRRIHEWADRYRAEGWPGRTPRYLLRPYGRLLITARDTRRLLGLAADPQRHDRMLARLHGDADAVDEILHTQDLLHAARESDVRSLALLAVYRDRLLRRNRAMPIALPAVWVRLGDLEKAEAMALSIPEPDRDVALVHVARALRETGHHDAARRITVSITDTAALARAQSPARAERPPTLQVEDWDKTERKVSTIVDPDRRAEALAALAERISNLDAGRASRLFVAADEAALQIDVAWRRVAKVVRVGMHMLRFDRAEALSRATDAAAVAHRFVDVNGDRDEARILCEVVRALSTAGEWDAAEKIFSRIYEQDSRDAAAESMAFALAEAGLWERAEQAVSRISVLRGQAEALTDFAWQLVAVDHDRAMRLANRAETLAREPDPEDLVAWGDGLDDVDNGLYLIKSLAAAQEWDRAEAVAALRRDWESDSAYAAIAEALTAQGLWDRAEQAAQCAGDTLYSVVALAALAKAVAPSDPARARQFAAQAQEVARGLSEDSRPVALGYVAGALSVTEPQKAAKLIVKVQRGARELERARKESDALRALAAAASAAAAIDPALASKLAVDVSRIARAEPTAGSVGDDHLSWAAELLAKDHREAALRLISLAEQKISSGGEIYNADSPGLVWGEWDHARACLVRALSVLEEWRRAEQLAGQIHSTVTRADALAAIATELLTHADHSDLGRAHEARARRIVGAILAGPRWMAALPPAAIIDPATAIPVADALHRFMPYRVRQE